MNRTSSVDDLDREVAHARAGIAERHPASGSRRALDLAVSVPLAILTLPLVAVLATVSAITFRAWPFYVQTRVGRGGRPFRFVKVRSLPVEVPDYLDKYALKNRMDSRWSEVLRRSHLDELPQLWHVVRGQMSLVGPRPEMLPLSGRFDAEFGAARVETPPGCTGIWQVSVHSDLLIGEAPQYDLFYLRHANRRLDLWILWRTLLVVLPGDHRVRLTEIPAACGVDPLELVHYEGLELPPAWRRREPARVPVAVPEDRHDHRSPAPASLAGLVTAEPRGTLS
jgi:lipopolysaccharide/colanic/teichoic acid biosynthesis glycosyltransferase